jgi:hypothetical protein
VKSVNKKKNSILKKVIWGVSLPLRVGIVLSLGILKAAYLGLSFCVIPPIYGRIKKAMMPEELKEWRKNDIEKFANRYVEVFGEDLRLRTREQKNHYKQKIIKRLNRKFLYYSFGNTSISKINGKPIISAITGKPFRSLGTYYRRSRGIALLDKKSFMDERIIFHELFHAFQCFSTYWHARKGFREGSADYVAILMTGQEGSDSYREFVRNFDLVADELGIKGALEANTELGKFSSFNERCKAVFGESINQLFKYDDTSNRVLLFEQRYIVAAEKAFMKKDVVRLQRLKGTLERDKNTSRDLLRALHFTDRHSKYRTAKQYISDCLDELERRMGFEDSSSTNRTRTSRNLRRVPASGPPLDEQERFPMR